MDTQFSETVPLLQGANSKYKVIGQNRLFDVEEGDVNQQRQVYQNTAPQINGKQERVVTQEVLFVRQVQKVDANVELPKFKFTPEEVIALKRVEIPFNQAGATVPTRQECQKFIQENQAALYMFSELKVDVEYGGRYDVPYIEYSKVKHNSDCSFVLLNIMLCGMMACIECCDKDSKATITIHFFKNANDRIMTDICGHVDLIETVSRKTNGLLTKMWMGESWVPGLSLSDGWLSKTIDDSHVSLPRYITNGLLSILRSRSGSIEAFASFLANKLDFYGLDAKSIYARVSSNQGLTDQEQKAIMEYAQAVRLE